MKPSSYLLGHGMDEDWGKTYIEGCQWEQNMERSTFTRVELFKIKRSCKCQK